jgi:uncharacterized protein (TIGR02598 family)
VKTNPVVHGFSLVEVVMALGIISFVIVGILGLLSVGLSTAKKSTRATNLSAISSQVISSIRNDTNTYTSAVLTGMVSTPVRFYFNYSGSPQTTSNSETFYLCEVGSETASSVLGATTLSGYTVLILTVSSPLAAPEANRDKEVLHATIPR